MFDVALRDSNELEIIVFPGTTSTLVCIFFLYFLLLIFLTAQTSSSLRYLLKFKFYYNFVYDFCCFLPNYTLKFNTNLQYCFLEKLHFELASCKNRSRS